MTQRFAFCPWRFAHESTADEREQQRGFHDRLVATGRFQLGADVYVSSLAGLESHRLVLGARSVVAGFAYLSHDVVLGEDCSVNPYAVVRGLVRTGNHVRIASHASVLGMNHNHDDLERPIREQGESSRGITIGDDVWIGANAVVLDGVSIGSHVIVAAGAVVTRDVADWQIVAGNPARPVRDRRDSRSADVADSPAAAGEDGAMPQPAVESSPAVPRTVSPRDQVRRSLGAQLASFGARAAAQWPAIVGRCRAPDSAGIAFVDRPGEPITGMRALADAIEIAAMFGELPAGCSREALIAHLQSTQDAKSGMPFDPWRRPPVDYAWDAMGDVHTAYMVPSTGHALECLGATFRAPLLAVQDMPTLRLAALLDGLPWRERAWSAGSWVDAFGTALWFNRAHFGLEGPIAALFEYLAQRCLPHTGLWGQARRDGGWLQPVNGYYRLTRGTYEMFGVRVPHPEAAVDTILAHVRLNGDFADRNIDACNLLDVVHPLRCLARTTSHRRGEAHAFIERQVPRILARWIEGEGFGFAPGDPPGLQGTEMWLAIIATAASALGLADELGYAPRGIHRL